MSETTRKPREPHEYFQESGLPADQWPAFLHGWVMRMSELIDAEKAEPAPPPAPEPVRPADDYLGYAARQLRCAADKQDEAPMSSEMHLEAALFAIREQRVPKPDEVYDYIIHSGTASPDRDEAAPEPVRPRGKASRREQEDARIEFELANEDLRREIESAPVALGVPDVKRLREACITWLQMFVVLEAVAGPQPIVPPQPTASPDRDEAARRLIAVEAKLREVSDLYHELLYAVETKHPSESRHQTALRYIRGAEHGKSLTAKTAFNSPVRELYPAPVAPGEAKS